MDAMERSRLILIVDDEENFREIFQAQLAAAGYQVVTATNGQEAVQKAKALKPGLILMDVRMPVMDGVAAAMAIREDQTLNETKIVFLTSLGDPSAEIQSNVDARFARGLGFQGYIKKTEDLRVIVDKVKEYNSEW